MRRAAAAVLVVGVLVTSACTGGDPGSAAPSPGLGASAAPATSPAVDPYSGSDADVLLQTVSDSAKLYGIQDPPDVAVVRTVTPDERTAVIVQCLADVGVTARAESDGWSVESPVDQSSAINLQQYICQAKYPLDPKYVRTLSEDQIRIFYGYVRDSLLPCLSGKGYDIDGLPTEDVYVDSFQSGQGAFDPYAVEPLVSTEQRVWESLQQACPPSPPTDVLYK